MITNIMRRTAQKPKMLPMKSPSKYLRIGVGVDYLN